MRRLVAAAGLVLAVASSAYAGPGSSAQPVFIQPGQTTDGQTVNCGTTTTALYNNPTDPNKSDLRSLTCKNLGATEVYLCAAASCTAGTAYALLAAKGAGTDSYTKNVSTRAVAFSCLAITSASNVICDAERGL